MLYSTSTTPINVEFSEKWFMLRLNPVNPGVIRSELPAR